MLDDNNHTRFKTPKACLAHYLSYQDPDEQAYSPLQFAAYDGNLLAVQALVAHYRTAQTFEAEMRYVNQSTEPGDRKQTQVNVFQVAIKHAAIFQYLFEEAKTIPHLEDTLLCQRDRDGDSVVHQIVEFGRAKVLQYLLDQEKAPLLRTLAATENIYTENAFYIAEYYDTSLTIQALKQAGFLTAENLPGLETRTKVQDLLSQLSME